MITQNRYKRFPISGFDSGLILNGTFDNTTNLTFDANFSIAGGVAVFTTNGVSTTYLHFGISSNLTASTNYTCTFTILNGTGTSRLRLYVRQGGGDVSVSSNVTHANGSVVINFTAPAGADSTRMSIGVSSLATSFDLDNVSLKTT